MAKKKVATHGNQTKKHEQDLEIATHGNQTKKQEQEVEIGMAMDDASMEKLQSLKDLNDFLVKQTIELRQQVSSLKQANGSLEAEVVQSKSEMDVLRTELTQLDERTVELELERTVVVVFAGQIGEVIESERNGFKKEKFEIEGKLEGLERKLVEVVGEKDENERMAKAEIKARTLELNDMKERLIEAEKREKLVSGDLEKLKSEYGSAMEEKEQMGRKIDEILRDKNLLEKSLIEYNTEINEIKGEIERIRIEKDEIKQEKDVEYLKRNELENAVTGLNVTVSSLQAEEEKLHFYVAELEYKCSEGVEKGIEMQRHLDELVKVKNEMEVRIQSLIDEKGLVDKDLNEALGKIDEYKLRMKEMADENDKIGVDNVEKENEIKELEKQVVGLRNVVSGFEKSCSDQQEKIKNLVSELDYYKDGFERVTMEKDEARKALDEEKQSALSLQQRIVDMEKNIEINLEMIKKIKAENSEISIEKEELDRHFRALKKDIATRNKEITDARSELSAMRGKSELADSKSQMVLNALKSTAVFVQSKDENDVSNGSYLLDDEQMKGEIELFVVEMEAIKNAFKTKENEANDMRKQLAKLENSVADAHRNKTLLTMVSSVTSLFAAISFAYLARGR